MVAKKSKSQVGWFPAAIVPNCHQVGGLNSSIDSLIVLRVKVRNQYHWAQINVSAGHTPQRLRGHQLSPLPASGDSHCPGPMTTLLKSLPLWLQALLPCVCHVSLHLSYKDTCDGISGPA